MSGYAGVASEGGLSPVVILGPTAGGKSALAVGLCERLAERDGVPGEVVSADSMQVYRHLDAGTAKPSASMQARVRHHLVDCVEPTRAWSVADWLDACRVAVGDMARRGARPVVVGGTNLYLKALLEGLMDGPGRDAVWRESVVGVPTAELYARLVEVDRPTAARVHVNDRKRIVRALEVHRLTGRPMSVQRGQWREEGGGGGDGGGGFSPLGDPIVLGLRWSAEAINPRINLRVKAMFYPEKVAAGDAENPPRPELAAETCPNGENLLAECRRLLKAGLLGEAAPQASEALGYKQGLAHLRGEMTEAQAFEKTKVETRRFAKNQRTWFKRFGQARWIDAATMSEEQRLDAAWAKVVEALQPRKGPPS